MSKQIFVNLPVTDLDRATAFYAAVGAKKEPLFSDHTASCMVFSETIRVMLLTHEKFAMFAPRPIADAKSVCAVLNCLSMESREACDAMVDKVQAAGGGLDPSPRQDHACMYGRSFEDPDGHIWELVWTDLEAFKAMAHNAPKKEPAST